MSVTILTVGKNKDKALQGLIDEYLKRLKGEVTITEIAPPQCSDAERKIREAELLRSAIPPKSLVIALDERGKTMDSPTFAAKLDQLQQQAQERLVFLIGGADGLDETLRNEAQLILCFGQMTWPHMLVRLMLVEQLYRAATISAGHPYHRV